MGLLARLRTNLCQASSSSCTSVVSWTCLPDSCLRSCCTCLNMPLDPETAGVMLHSSPRSLRHLRTEVLRASQGMVASAAATLSRRVGGRQSKCTIVSRSQPSIFFWVDHSPSTCTSFLREMGSFLLVLDSLLGRNTHYI